MLVAVKELTTALATHSLLEDSSSPPINALPSEILAQIFLLVNNNGRRTEEEDGEKDTVRQPSLGAELKNAIVPLRLSHVCKLWRSIAVDACFLWTKLYLEIDGSERARKNAGHLVSIFGRRSKSAPLFIGIEFLRNRRTRSGSSRTLGSDIVLEQLQEVVQRAAVEKQDLKLQSSEESEPDFEVHLVSVVPRRSAVPLTEEQYFWRYYRDKGEDKVTRTEDAAPRNVEIIRLSVEAKRYVHNFFSIEEYLPISVAVTDLRLNDANGLRPSSESPSKELAMILRSMPMLEQFAFHVQRDQTLNEEEEEHPVDIIEMKHLKALELSWDGADKHGGYVLDSIHSPILKSLKLSGEISGWEASWEHLYSFLARHNSNARSILKDLTLEHIDCTIIRLHACLKMTTESLTRLALEDCTLSNEILQSLTRANNSEGFVPVLSRLKSLSLIAIDNISGDCLVRCIEVTQRESKALEELYLKECSLVDVIHCDKLRKLLRLCKEGNIVVYPSAENDQLQEHQDNESTSDED